LSNYLKFYFNFSIIVFNLDAKYAFLGSIRSSAAMISYELILSSAILLVIILTGSLNFNTIVEHQQAIWFILPLLPVFIFYFISILAETSRTPFDLQEANPTNNDLASIKFAICWNILKL